jgi:hypothetical protein
MFVLCLLYKDGSMEHKGTCRRTEGFKKYKMDQRKRTGQEKKIPPGACIFVLCLS